MQIDLDCFDRLSNLNLLYVESDSDLKEINTKEYAEYFNTVHSCQNAKEALIRYTQLYYDIVITDVDIEGLSGSSLSKQIRAINPNQIIIVLTKNSNEKNLLDFIELGVEGYLLKPISAKESLDKLITILDKIVIKGEMCDGNYLDKMLEAKTKDIVYEMTHDKLTGLRNNFALVDFLKKSKELNILMLNIDNFSNTNNAYGFEVGDEVLIQVTEYLKFLKPMSSRLYRLDSDEFVLVDDTKLDIDVLKSLAESIISFFNESEIELEDGIDMKVSFSIGIASGSSATTVLNNAKAAVKDLREHTRGSYKFFDEKSKYIKRQTDNIYWIDNLKKTINSGNLFAYFQPIINNRSKKIEKYECLARINDDGVLVSPAMFMEAAKITGMLSNITRTIIDQSCKVFSTNDIEFSINITNDDLYMEYLEGYLVRYTSKYNIEPSRIVLEILEDVRTLSEPRILEQLHSLREKGFKIAIDDFGSESSNFSRLLEFSPDYIKIDGSFIKNILRDSKSLTIVEAIVLIAHKSNIKVIAEFVHSKEVLDKVLELGIDYSQGYYFSEARVGLQ